MGQRRSTTFRRASARGWAVLVTLALLLGSPAGTSLTARADQADAVESRLRRVERSIERHRRDLRAALTVLRRVERRAKTAERRVRQRIELARILALRNGDLGHDLTDRVRRAERHRERTRSSARSLRRERARHAGAIRRLQGAERHGERLLADLRPIGVCPVRGVTAISDDFGAPRWDDGRSHTHQGNDITAPFGAPVVAPFDGVASASHSDLGGMTVRVRGPHGEVVNAHLSRYGTLGQVGAGTVVGYVGATGNAQGPHDHFEWHPGGGAAVDPHDLLIEVC
jgi:murein DD-endopeptidase MepM/ murein hydrolase activator NlpD